MRYSNFDLPRKKILSINDTKDYLEIEKELYQQFLRDSKINTKNISLNNFENIFTNEIYYKSMKSLPILEKQILYLYFYDGKNLSEICKILKKSKTEIVKLKALAICHFKENVTKYKKFYSKKNGCDVNK